MWVSILFSRSRLLWHHANSLVIVATILVAEQIVEMVRRRIYYLDSPLHRHERNWSQPFSPSQVLLFFAARSSSSLVRKPSIAHLVHKSSNPNFVYDLGPMQEEPFDATELYESPGAILAKKEGEDYFSDKEEETQWVSLMCLSLGNSIAIMDDGRWKHGTITLIWAPSIWFRLGHPQHNQSQSLLCIGFQDIPLAIHIMHMQHPHSSVPFACLLIGLAIYDLSFSAILAFDCYCCVYILTSRYLGFHIGGANIQ